ncbi:MAG: nucleoside monophosphate kinase [Candidatus Kerfeldbacteria bacterium]|nr:nucleoside monophosphate kinase [Candidatus Kerfeldbacteria bacterium]
MNHNQQFIFMGPQGSGKGTQAKALAAKLQVPHISTGEIFRQAMSAGSELGQKVKAVVDKGILMPNEITNQLVLAKIKDKNGFILDGYPRNLAQAEFLDRVAPEVQVIDLELTDDEAVARIAGRWNCSLCGAVYHLKYSPPKQEGLCDKCGGLLTQRADDVPAVIRQRLQTYHQATEPLLEYYRGRGRLLVIDGTPPIAEVTENIFRALGL